MTKNKILVSVLNYNETDDVISTLESLSNFVGVDFDLELVDNASTNGCLEFIEPRIKHLPVRIIRNSKNSGYAGGMNAILHRGFNLNYEYILICNGDIEVEKNALIDMLEIAKVNPNAAVVGAVEMCYYSREIRAIGGGGFSFWLGRGKWLNDSKILCGSVSGEYSCVQGAFVLFTKEAHLKNIYMDENLFLYYEEADLGFKISAAGLCACVAHKVAFLHKSQSKFLDIRSGYYQQRNRIYIVRKHGRLYNYIFFIIYLSIVELPVKFLIRALQGNVRYGFSCYRGFIDGVMGITGRWKNHYR